MKAAVYTDPLVIILGSLVIVAVTLLAMWVASWWLVVYLVDNSTDYCDATKTYILVKDCKSAR